MGMPACRITDPTAHGGIIVLGFPTVLIGYMPASRIGDLHICPTVTGIVPHVGGPFVLGSFTVLVGNMPQSRVTDMLICVGPPDIAVMGEPTVLVGMVGMGGIVAASTGMQMSGAATTIASTASNATSNLTATLQQDGTTKVAAAVGSLPPITLQQPGWPDLPAADTINFSSVQPVTLPLGTPLSALQDTAGAPSSYFMPAVPPELANATTSPLNAGKQVVSAVVDKADGVKAWMGQAANSAKQDATQIWAQAGAVSSQAQHAAKSATVAASAAEQSATNALKEVPHV
ncbi:MAG TPA: PAAR domain-containing protein [Granulicella sp.]|jgi:uncharacterized Zn-binding protein involved in type VI secretion